MTHYSGQFPTIADFAGGRDNNFNLLRFIAAFAVMVDHSFVLVTGTPSSEPFRHSLGLALGSIAVEAFFLMSGFLVTASLFSRQNLWAFLWARILRIYPALIVVVLICAFGLGLFFTSLPAADYLGHPETLRFALLNGSLLRIVLTLPGVFDFLPWPRMINGSLWTLPIEFMMYLALAALWAALWILRSWRSRVLRAIIIVMSIVLIGAIFSNYIRGLEENYILRMVYMFVLGAAMHVLRTRISLTPTYLTIAISLLAVSMLDKEFFFFIYLLTFGYILIGLAYLPGGKIRGFNRIGDFSYGIYIYAFPIQQSPMATVKGLGVLQLTVAAGVLTIAAGALSWHLIEKHALRLKRGSAQ